MTCSVVCTGESQITSVYSSALTQRMFASVNGKRDLVPVRNRSRLQEQSLQSAYKAEGWELISVVQTVITIYTEFIAYSFYKRHSPMYLFAFYYFTTLNHVFFFYLAFLNSDPCGKNLYKMRHVKGVCIHFIGTIRRQYK